MKQVIFIDEQKEQEEKPVEFTHYLSVYEGWKEAVLKLTQANINSIIYLGKCARDGDIFSVRFDDDTISIYKGHLNSGKY